MAWFVSLFSTGEELETTKLDRRIDGGMVYAPVEFGGLKCNPGEE